MITVVFLGRLRDVAGVRQQVVPVPAGSTVADLIAALDASSPGLGGHLADASVRVAINHALAPADANAPLAAGDEVAFLPPVTGG